MDERCQKGTKTPMAARFPVNTVSSNAWRAVENEEEMNNKQRRLVSVRLAVASLSLSVTSVFSDTMECREGGGR